MKSLYIFFAVRQFDRFLPPRKTKSVRHPDAAAIKSLPPECRQLLKIPILWRTVRFVIGTIKTAEYFDLLFMVLLFNQPKVDQSRQYPKLEEEFKNKALLS